MAGAALSNAMKLTLAGYLDQTATVYTRASSGGGPGGGGFTTTAQSGLKCLLQEAGAGPEASGPQRAERADRDILYWDPAYEMPEQAQVEVSTRPGVRWNVVAGTVVPDVGPGAVVVMRHAEVRRARAG